MTFYQIFLKILKAEPNDDKYAYFMYPLAEFKEVFYYEWLRRYKEMFSDKR